MPLRITLDNHEVIEADITLADWNRAYQQAVAGNTMLEIQGPEGQVLSINPQRVNVVEATEAPQAAQQRESAAA